MTSSEPRPVLFLAYAKPFFQDAGNTQSGHSLVKSRDLPSSSLVSPVWVSRILSGDAVAFVCGFEDCSSISSSKAPPIEKSKSDQYNKDDQQNNRIMASENNNQCDGGNKKHVDDSILGSKAIDTNGSDEI